MARESSLAGVKKKAPPKRVRLFIWRLAVTYSRTGTPALPSAMHRFTAEFEMGSGGSNALLPPGKLLETSQSHSGVSRSLRPTLGCSVKNRAGFRHCVLCQTKISFEEVRFVCVVLLHGTECGSVCKYTTVSVECQSAAQADLTKSKRVLVLYDQVTRAISTG